MEINYIEIYFNEIFTIQSETAKKMPLHHLAPKALIPRTTRYNLGKIVVQGYSFNTLTNFQHFSS